MLVRACQEDPEARAAAWSGPPAGRAFVRSLTRSLNPGPPVAVRPPAHAHLAWGAPPAFGRHDRFRPLLLSLSPRSKNSCFCLPLGHGPAPLSPETRRGVGVSECARVWRCFWCWCWVPVFPFARIRTHLHDVLRSLMSAAVPGGDYIDGGPMSLPREEAAALSSPFFLNLSLFLLVRFFPSLKRHSTLVICRRHCPSSANRTPPHPHTYAL
jgi:hypothetical protein